MINKFVNNQKAVRGTALSFAVVGTLMHGLNIMHATNSTVSQVWSMVAIIGFFFTVTNFVNGRPLFEASKIRLHFRHHSHLSNVTSLTSAKDEVALP
jgi:hypothetical protein